MNWGNAILWGFVSTIILTTTMSASVGLGLTRMDLPFLLGTAFTGNRDRARLLGFVLHFLNGWAFAFLYIWAFIVTGLRHWWFGIAIGVVQAMFVLVVGMMLLPAVHPRMANEQQGPDPTRQLEPPGFLALNYGRQTPIATILAHVLYGGLLGWFYH